jgi:hypothetical protein
MPKYYVSSGQINMIISGQSASDAILSALNSYIERHGLELELEPPIYTS